MAKNGHKSFHELPTENASPQTRPEVVEFNWPLHVCKRLKRDGEAEAYTIAVWNGRVLESICLFQPLESALAALGSRLKSAGVANCRSPRPRA